MKAFFSVRPNLQFEIEEKAQVNLFEEIARLQEVFGEEKCGLCNATDLRFANRVVEENTYHEIQCKACGAKLALSQNQKGGTLYPNRKLKPNEVTGVGLRPAKVDEKEPFEWKTRGWHKYQTKAEQKQPEQRKK